MIPLADVITRFEVDYLRQYGPTLLPSQRQALAAMKQCRTVLAPRFLAACSACDETRLVPHSCGHRSCPHCQHHESQQWLERQLKRQVPADYFLLTFTVPAELRQLAWQHQRAFYAVLFDCAWATVTCLLGFTEAPFGATAALGRKSGKNADLSGKTAKARAGLSQERCRTSDRRGFPVQKAQIRQEQRRDISSGY